ncbi:MAG: nitronate monooxygenase [Proteobacteria bacterium]|nr:nitronate monooxygenase [Pseudomonadota bacterium]
MGASISGWPLAKSVAKAGHLGVVSGTALDLVLARFLQVGDTGGHFRRALSHFPDSDAANRILEKYFVEGGKKDDEPFKSIPVFTIDPSDELIELTVIANFCEVFLAKEGHSGLIGINYLEKIQLPNIYSLYGAMLAGVEYVLVGAGIPIEVPGILDLLANHKAVKMSLDVEGAEPGEGFAAHFDPSAHFNGKLTGLEITRPMFLAIIASSVLALTLTKRSTGKVNGFVIEKPEAGGHNASPRGKMKLNEKGEPIYGPKDELNIEKIKSTGLPFWLAGGYGTHDGLKEAQAVGAAGIQTGTAFAFCAESGLASNLKEALVAQAIDGTVEIFTDPKASPTGYPFKVARLAGTVSEESEYANRKRICDLGYLRHLYKREDGSVGYRCPSEPVEAYVKKGGAEQETVGRKCLCNGLMSNIGLAQRQRNGYIELPFITTGLDLEQIGRFIKEGRKGYTAQDVIDEIVG